jgi:16S rRNA (guanine1207-N2)-methyltransferase
MTTSPGHYFDADPSVPSQLSSVTLTLPDRTVDLTTDRGVFAGDRVDAGTKYLLLDGPPVPAAGNVLDLGCGYGAIACTLAARSPGATVWAIDVNRRARELCAHNASALGLQNVQVAAPEDVPDDVTFAAVWSNPPIRIGKPALHQLLRTWLARLLPDGHAALVVSKHLGSDSLAIWLQRQGWPVERLGSRQGYRILSVDAAPGPPP